MRNRIGFLAAVAVLCGLVGFGTVPAWAREIKIGVKGMVCAFCAQGIEKKFHAQPAVEQVNVSLGQKSVRLGLKAGQDISDASIQSILKDSGYNVDKIERD